MKVDVAAGAGAERHAIRFVWRKRRRCRDGERCGRVGTDVGSIRGAARIAVVKHARVHVKRPLRSRCRGCCKQKCAPPCNAATRPIANAVLGPKTRPTAAINQRFRDAACLLLPHAVAIARFVPTNDAGCCEMRRRPSEKPLAKRALRRVRPLHVVARLI